MLNLNKNSEGRFDVEPSKTLQNSPKVIGVRELLRWAYQDQAVDELSRKDIYGHAPLRSNLISIQQNGLLETKIDCAGSSRYAIGQVNEDAEVVHEAVCRMRAEEIGLVIYHAKTASVPECYVGVEAEMRPVALRDEKGKPVVEFHDAIKRRRPSHCLLTYFPVTPEHLAFARGIYSLWWSALDRLASKGLRDLDGYVIQGPDLPPRPWLSSGVDSWDKI